MKNIEILRLNQIVANRYQPREYFDDSDLEELAESISANGLIQPIVVRKNNDHYEIIAGERRFRACNLLGLKEITCVVEDVNDYQSAQMALVENIQRANLSSIEEAKAYKQILEQTDMTQAELATKMGKSQAAIANKIRLLALPLNIQARVSDKSLTERHARALLNVDEDKLDNAVNNIIKKQLTVAETEKYIETISGPKKRVVQSKGFTKNIQIGINTIKQSHQMCEKAGISSQLEIQEDDDEVRVIIKFSKKGE